MKKVEMGGNDPMKVTLFFIIRRSNTVQSCSLRQVSCKEGGICLLLEGEPVCISVTLPQTPRLFFHLSPFRSSIMSRKQVVV